MIIFLRYSIYFSILLSFVLFYLIFTPLGNQNSYRYIGYLLSQKMNLDVEVKSINLVNYPLVTAQLTIEHKAQIIFDGYVDDTMLDINYRFNSNCIASDNCKVDDEIDISGNIKGKFNKIYIKGMGKALDGNISYHATKFIDKIEDISIDMKEINSTKLFKLLGQKTLINGKANLSINFAWMDNERKKGSFIYDVKDNNFSGIPLSLHTVIDIVNMKQSFITDITTDDLKLNIYNGSYNQNKKVAKASYSLDIKDLSKLETILGYKYLGSFSSNGDIRYDKHLTITGMSQQYGGFINYKFEKNVLKFKLDGVSISEFMTLFPFSQILDGYAKGVITYDFIDKSLLVNTKLNNTKFLPSTLVYTFYDKSNVDLMIERFNNSSLNLKYKNHQFLINLILKNQYNHIYLNTTHIDTTLNTIDGFFDVKMQRQEFSGKIYGSLNKPKINLDMQKLIEYQMDKQLDSIMGRRNRKMIESIPLTGVAKDVATEATASFIGMFF